MKINWKLGAAAIAAAGGGGLIGYYVAYKKLTREFRNSLDAELRSAEDYYKRLYKVGDFETPEQAAAVLLSPEKLEQAEKLQDRATKALQIYSPDPAGLEEIKNSRQRPQYHKDVAPGTRSVWDSPTPTDPGAETPAHDRNKPYRISASDFEAGEDYVQHTYTWYEGDHVLGAENDERIENPDEVVGLHNLTQFGVDADDDNTLYIRNELRMEEYEIVKSTGRYDVEVMGLVFDDPTE